MKFQRIDYARLSGKQQEIYNFQKIAGVLADYGFNCIKLDDDWLGADFLAYHKDGSETLKVQLKSRPGIDRKYLGKGLHIAFPLAGGWCVVEHDELVRIVGEATNWLQTASWTLEGNYHSARPPQKLAAALAAYTIGAARSLGRLFDVPPDNWGLRGDPQLWAEMRERFSSMPFPDSAETLGSLVAAAFEELAGSPITAAGGVMVERYDRGGMSGGQVSPEFWRETVLPLLQARLAGEAGRR